jgi:hypothetical protein
MFQHKRRLMECSAELGGKQVDISYWTGNCSGIAYPGITHNYKCYATEKQRFIKNCL